MYDVATSENVSDSNHHRISNSLMNSQSKSIAARINDDTTTCFINTNFHTK